MPRLLLLLALAALAAAPADAQRRRGRDDDGAFARKGDAALTFSFDALSPGPFEGGVGGRFWVSDRVVAAASLGFGYGRVDAGYGDQDALTTSFALGVERHFGRSRRVSPFVALGARVDHVAFDREDVYYYAPPCVPEEPCPAYGVPFSVETRETSVGGALFLGAEVRVLEGVTLAAAHSLGVTYTRGSVDAPPIYYPGFPPGCERCEPTPAGDLSLLSPDRVTFGTGTSALTLSIYF
jgi:hypothetical protein